KIRSTLSVIERYKFYFNLPFNLIEYTRKGKFDIAVREYKKGRQLLQVVTKGDTGTGEETMPNMDGTSSTALSNIFHHVWKEVQSSVVELRNALFKHLSQPWKPYPEQEKAIRFLLEIDPGEQDPVAYYLEHHHAWIIDQMDELYKGHKQKLAQTGHQQYLPSERRRGHSTDGAAGSATAKDPALEVERRADELTRALQIESFADFPAFTHGRDSEFHMWKQIYNALRTLSQTLVRCLPDFWKLSQAYMEDLYQKPGSNGDGVAGGGGRRRRQMLDLDKVTKCHALLEDIIEKYSRHVLRMTGVLGDTDLIINLDSLGRSQIGTTLQRLPQTHALLAGHFMTAIMELVVNTANDIEAIDMAQEPAIIFANLISQLKAGLVLFLCEMWDRDARSMSLHENWRLHHGTSYWPPFYIARRRQDKGDSPSTTAENIANTELLPLFLRTAQTLIGQLGAIHAAALQPGKSTRTLAQGQTPHFNADFDEGQRQQSERSHQLHDMAVSHTKRTFFGTMYSFLDTLHVLAFNTMPYGAGDGNGGVSAAAGARPSSSSLAQQSPLAKSMLPRRLSFNLPSKSDTGGALATN
ncbi:Exocyst complex component S5, partial [Dipsacomyces acuminosporus]